MTAAASKPARRGSTAYRSMTQPVQHSPVHFTVYADPYPVHSASVTRQGAHGAWKVQMLSVPTVTPSYVYADLDKALQVAAELVGRKTGAEWRAKFTGAQRYAIGQQKCPYGTGPLCGQSPEPGSIWCAWHPKGRMREI